MDEQKHLVTLVDATDDVIIGKDAAGLIQSWNRAAERVLGYTEAELVGQSIRLIWPPELHDEEQPSLCRVLAGQGARHYETVRLHKDGHRVPMSVTISPITTPQEKSSGHAPSRKMSPGGASSAMPATWPRSSTRATTRSSARIWTASSLMECGCEAMFGYSAEEMIGDRSAISSGRSSAGGGRGPPADPCRAEGRAL